MVIPSTPAAALGEVLPQVSLVLVMTVNPGFGAQKFIASMLPKIAAARKMADRCGREINIGVDGGINLETCAKVVAAGANVLVAGNFVFTYPGGVDEAVKVLRKSCGNY